MLNSVYNWCCAPVQAVESTEEKTFAALTDGQKTCIVQTIKNIPNSNCLSLEQRTVVADPSSKSVINLNSFKFASEVTFLEVFEDSVTINTASWYGTPLWNGCIWFSGQQANVNGLLSVKADSFEMSQFYPLQGVPSNFVATLVPECSKEGLQGYACIFEDGVNEFGVSLWNMQAEPPRQLFRQGGFLTTRFIGSRLLLAVDAQGQFVCWDLESHKLRYAISGWIERGEAFPSFGPYIASQQRLFVSNGSWMHVFDLGARRLVDKFNLPITSGVGAFHMESVSDRYVFFREVSCGRLFVYDIVQSKQSASFSIGGSVNEIDNDNFPSCAYQNMLVALAEDRKTVCFYDPATGNVIRIFTPASTCITGLHCTENRLIANCQCTAKDTPSEDKVYIWDISSGKEIKAITSPEGYGMVPQDITEKKLALYLYPKAANVSAVNAPKMKAASRPQSPYSSQNFHWTAPNNLMLDDNKLRLQIWDTESCLLQKAIYEEFKPSNDDVTFAKYESGKLTVDASSVILQTL